jgi:hypothetical protein
MLVRPDKCSCLARPQVLRKIIGHLIGPQLSGRGDRAEDGGNVASYLALR